MIGALYDALRAELPAVPILLGAQGLAEHAAPPRIVLVPGGEVLEPPTKAGLLQGDGPQTLERPIYTRRSTLSLYLWGRDYGEVEGMLTEVANALHRRYAGLVVPRRGEWIEGGAISLGVAYRLEAEAAIPVSRRDRYVVLESLAMQCARLEGG